MGKKRSEIEILADILRVAMEGAKKSHICLLYTSDAADE